MERQFTATVYIIDQDKVLLIYHKKLKKWLPPGGHIDPNELPSDGARREAFEETGLQIEFITQENIWIDRWNAKSFPRPYMCLLEKIPAHGDKPAHEHMDMIYVAKPNGGDLTLNHHETDDMRWFTLEDLQSLKSDEEIFEETLQTLKHLISQNLI